jgi:leucyl/phenylalanyl-tRNA--protein transferase
LNIIFHPEVVLNAYKEGYFPMADDRDGDIYWHSPDPRAIFPINEIVPPKKVAKSIKNKQFNYTINNRFSEVIMSCANRDFTWINEDIINTYIDLNENGYAHSIEVYQNDNLVGGLYGVAMNGAFFGESMFNLVPDAAKAAFYFLVEHLNSKGFMLLDSQYLNPFTQQLGAIEIDRNLYLYLLDRALELDCKFE